MAQSFNLTAQLNLRGPTNVRQIVAGIRRDLGTVSANVQLRLDPSAIRNTTGLNSALRNLNATLATTTTNATSAARAMRSFATAVNGVNMRNMPQQLNSAATAITRINNVSSRTAGNVQDATSEMTEFGKQAGLAVRRFAAFTGVTSVIFGLTNAISKGVDAFIEYDKQFVKLQQVTGESANGLKGLASMISSLSTGLGVASSDLTEVSSTLAQAGLSAKDTERALKALALSSLAPSFDSMNETVEGSIALMRQFGISASDLEKALGSVNAVAAKFAVESGDIIAAIQRTGGVFASASRGVSEGTDALNEFIAVFTSVRATTRESAETIATGLRTIFTRIQRGPTINALKQFGVDLTDAQGKFVGAYKAVELLSKGLNSIDPRDLRFSQIVEELGGFRQIGKVIPLIQQFATAQEALKVAQKGQGSLAADAAKAQESLSNKITKVKEEFLTLFREIGSSKGFQDMIRGALDLSSALIKVADSVKGVIPVLGVLAAFRGASALTQFGAGFLGAVRGQRKSEGGPIRKFARGGLVPGSGDSDSVSAKLTPGEFVMRKSAVKSIGVGNLSRMNTGGSIRKLREGGYSVGELASSQKTIIDNYLYPRNKKSNLELNDKVSAQIIRVKEKPLTSAEINSIREAYPLTKRLREKIKSGKNRKLLVEAQQKTYQGPESDTVDGLEYSRAEKAWATKYEEIIRTRHNLEAANKDDPNHPVDTVSSRNVWGEVKFKTSRESKRALIAKLLAKKLLDGKVNRFFRENDSNLVDGSTETDPLGRNTVNLGNLEYYGGYTGSGSESHKKQFYRQLNTGGIIQKFMAGSPGGVKAAEPTPGELALQKATTSDIIKLLGAERAARAAGVSIAEVNQLIRSKDPAKKALQEAIDKEYIKAINRKAGGAKRQQARLAAQGLVVGAAGMFGKPFDKTEEIESPLLSSSPKVRIIGGVLNPKLAQKFDKEFTASSDKTAFRLAKKATISDIRTRLRKGAFLDTDFDRTLVFGADKIPKDPKAPPFSEFSDPVKVSAALNKRSTRLSRLGESLKSLVGKYPEVLPRIRVITARPASTIPLLQEWLKNQGLPITRFEGVGQPNVTAQDIADLKASKLSPGSLFVDDDATNIAAAQARGDVKTYQYGAQLYKRNINTDSSIQGGLLEKVIQNLGGPGSLKGLGFDFPNGLREAAKFFNLPHDIPTDVKRTLSGPSTITDNIVTYLKNVMGYADGGTVPAMVSNGEAYVPPDMARRIGYGKLNRMNRADKNGMAGFAGGGVSVFSGPGSGTSDSIGPIGLPVGSFILREKATKALGLKPGGTVSKFADGGPAGLLDADQLQTAASGSLLSSTRDFSRGLSTLFTNVRTFTRNLQADATVMAAIGQTAATSGRNFNQLMTTMSGAPPTFRQLEDALKRDIMALRSAGAATDIVAQREQVLATAREAQAAIVDRLTTQQSSRLNQFFVNLQDRITALGNSINSIPGVGRVTGGIGRIGGALGGNTGFYMSMGLGMLAGQGENIFGKRDSSANSAYYSSAFETGTSTLATGVATASSLAMIPGIGPFLAGITAITSVVTALTSGMREGEKALKEFNKNLANKKAEDASDRLSKALEQLSKDVDNVDLQKKVSDRLREALNTTNATISSDLDEAKTTAKSRDVSKMSYMEYIGSSIPFFGTKMPESRLGVEDYDTVARQVSSRYTEENTAAMKNVEKALRSGARVSDIASGSKYAGEREAIVRSDPDAFAKILPLIEQEQAAIKAGNDVRAKEIKLQIDEATSRALLNNTNVTALKKTIELEQAMEEANKAGRRLAISFNKLYDAIDQSINRVQFESQQRQAALEDSSNNLTGESKTRSLSSKASNVLRNIEGYKNDPQAIQDAISSTSNMLGAKAGQRVAGAAKLAIELPDDITKSISEELRSNRGLDPDAAAARAIEIGRNKINDLSLPEEDKKNLIAQFEGRIKDAQGEIKKDESGLNTEASVDKFLEKVGEAGSGLGEMGKKILEVSAKLADFGVEALNQFSNNIALAAKSAKKAADLQARARDIRYRSGMDLREAQTGVAESFDEANAKFMSDIGNLTGGVTDPRAIGRNIEGLNRLNRQYSDIEKQKQAALNSGDVESAAKFTQQLQDTTDKLNNNKEALDKLANSAELAQKALDEVKNIRGLQQNREDFVNQLLTNTPEEADKLNMTMIRLQRNLSGGLNNPANQRDARNAFNDTLRRTGNVREAARAGNTVLANQRKETLQLMKDPGFRGMMELNMRNSGMNSEQVEQRFNAMEGQLMQQMAIESGMIRNPMVQQALAAKRNPYADPAMTAAADKFLQSTGLAATATEEQARLELINQQKILSTSTDNLKQSIDSLKATIDANMGLNSSSSAPIGADPAVDAGAIAGISGRLLPMNLGIRKPLGIMSNNNQNPKPEEEDPLFASTGRYVDFKPRGTDTVPAMLTPGEFVVNAKATSQHLPLLQAINSGSDAIVSKTMSRGGVVYLASGGKASSPKKEEKQPQSKPAEAPAATQAPAAAGGEAPSDPAPTPPDEPKGAKELGQDLDQRAADAVANNNVSSATASNAVKDQAQVVSDMAKGRAAAIQSGQFDPGPGTKAEKDEAKAQGLTVQEMKFNKQQQMLSRLSDKDRQLRVDQLKTTGKFVEPSPMQTEVLKLQSMEQTMKMANRVEQYENLPPQLKGEYIRSGGKPPEQSSQDLRNNVISAQPAYYGGPKASSQQRNFQGATIPTIGNPFFTEVAVESDLSDDQNNRYNELQQKVDKGKFGKNDPLTPAEREEYRGLRAGRELPNVPSRNDTARLRALANLPYRTPDQDKEYTRLRYQNDRYVSTTSDGKRKTPSNIKPGETFDDFEKRRQSESKDRENRRYDALAAKGPDYPHNKSDQEFLDNTNQKRDEESRNARTRQIAEDRKAREKKEEERVAADKKKWDDKWGHLDGPSKVDQLKSQWAEEDKERKRKRDADYQAKLNQINRDYEDKRQSRAAAEAQRQALEAEKQQQAAAAKQKADAEARSRAAEEEEKKRQDSLWVNSSNPITAGFGYVAGVAQAAGETAYGAANVVGGLATAAVSPVIGAVVGNESARSAQLDAKIKVNQQKNEAALGMPLAQAQGKVEDKGVTPTQAAMNVGLTAAAQGAYTGVELGQAIIGQGPHQTGQQSVLSAGDDERVRIAGSLGGATRVFQNIGYGAAQGATMLAGGAASAPQSVLGRAARTFSAIENIATSPIVRGLGRIAKPIDRVFGFSDYPKVARAVGGASARVGKGIAKRAADTPLGRGVKDVVDAMKDTAMGRGRYLDDAKRASRYNRIPGGSRTSQIVSERANRLKETKALRERGFRGNRSNKARTDSTIRWLDDLKTQEAMENFTDPSRVRKYVSDKFIRQYSQATDPAVRRGLLNQAKKLEKDIMKKSGLKSSPKSLDQKMRQMLKEERSIYAPAYQRAKSLEFDTGMEGFSSKIKDEMTDVIARRTNAIKKATEKTAKRTKARATTKNMPRPSTQTAEETGGKVYRSSSRDRGSLRIGQGIDDFKLRDLPMGTELDIPGLDLGPSLAKIREDAATQAQKAAIASGRVKVPPVPMTPRQSAVVRAASDSNPPTLSNITKTLGQTKPKSILQQGYKPIRGGALKKFIGSGQVYGGGNTLYVKGGKLYTFDTDNRRLIGMTKDEDGNYIRTGMTAISRQHGGLVYANNGALIAAQNQGTDTVPAMLTPGEFVVNRDMASKHMPLLNAINNGYYSAGGPVRYMANGGIVTPNYMNEGGPTPSLPPIVSGGVSNGTGGINTGGLSSMVDSLQKAVNDLGSLDMSQIATTIENSTKSFIAAGFQVGSSISSAANQMQQVAPQFNEVKGDFTFKHEFGTGAAAANNVLAHLGPTMKQTAAQTVGSALNKINKGAGQLGEGIYGPDTSQIMGGNPTA